jgi:hypothetical protein
MVHLFRPELAQRQLSSSLGGVTVPPAAKGAHLAPPPAPRAEPRAKRKLRSARKVQTLGPALHKQVLIVRPRFARVTRNSVCMAEQRTTLYNCFGLITAAAAVRGTHTVAATERADKHKIFDEARFVCRCGRRRRLSDTCHACQRQCHAVATPAWCTTHAVEASAYARMRF